MASVLVPLAEGSEELEAVTLTDVLRRAAFDVTVAGLGPGAVTCSRGVVLQPDTDLASVENAAFDLIVLPGGAAGADRLRADARLAAMLRRHRDADRWTGAICAAPSVLAAHGHLEGRRATAFPGALEAFDVESTEAPVESDGHVVTSRGPGTAMDFALALVEGLGSRELRREVEARLQR